jgi:hypothetical protein
MLVARIRGFTRTLGAPWNWDNAKQGKCGSLPIRDIETTAGATMESAWHPTPEEIEALRNGAPVILSVVGHIHPPVMLSVGTAPTDEWPKARA